MFSHKHLSFLAASLACACLLAACSNSDGGSDQAADTTSNSTHAESVIPTEPEETTDTAPESDAVTEESTEASFEIEIGIETETDTETEAETEPEPFPPAVTYHTMPLWGKDDTTSRLAILDYPEEAEKADRIVFQILPADTSNGKHVDAHTVFVDGESHILVLAYTHKETGDYSIVVLQERSYTRETATGDELRVVEANCYRLGCSNTLIPITQEQLAYATTYNGAGHTLSYTEQTKFSQLATATAQLKNIQYTGEHLLSGVNTEEYELTVLFSLADGETKINIPLTEVPTFSWGIVEKYTSVK